MVIQFIRTISCAVLVFAGSLGVSAASYVVKWTAVGSTKIAVTATLGISGTKLQMEESWPGNVPTVAEKGWPGLVRDLVVVDASGLSIGYKNSGPSGWVLDAPYSGNLTLTYTIDYSEAAAANWPAPREAAFADADHFTFAGKSVFITTPRSGPADVKFVLNKGWQAVAPWPRTTAYGFRPASTDDLLDNIVVFTRAAPDVVSVGGFRVTIIPMGDWVKVRSRTKRILQNVIPFYIKMMGPESGAYSVVLLPISDSGGESYRNSFAFNVITPATEQNSSDWGHTIAHEIFHYWNGWRLSGTDYPSSQWFQEGFTDYAADMAMAGSGVIKERDFFSRIESNIAKYRKLTTPLDAPGTRKGPPLYGGGALVALCWDIQIRNATGGKRTLGDMLRTLWRQSDHGKKSYGWLEIQAALEQTAQLDSDAFYRSYIHGSEKLPLDSTLKIAGLIIRKAENGTEAVEVDPAASPIARSLLRSLTSRRR